MATTTGRGGVLVRGVFRGLLVRGFIVLVFIVLVFIVLVFIALRRNGASERYGYGEAGRFSLVFIQLFCSVYVCMYA